MARIPGFDLNTMVNPATTEHHDWVSQDRGAQSGKVIAHLGDIAAPLIRFLEQSESIVGCVAWITSPRFVAALSGTPVSLIVNKEWALRSTDSSPSAVRNRATLAQLHGGLHRRDFGAPLSLIESADDSIDAVRCAGHLSRTRMPNQPLMHHKFVVRLTRGKPVAVWVGSFNFTVNASSSFESSVEVHDPVIARAFLAEWSRIAALSEPLEFKAGKAEADWGTRRTRVAAAPRAKAPVKKRAAKPGRPRAKPKAAGTRRPKAAAGRRAPRT